MVPFGAKNPGTCRGWFGASVGPELFWYPDWGPLRLTRKPCFPVSASGEAPGTSPALRAN